MRSPAWPSCITRTAIACTLAAAGAPAPVEAQPNPIVVLVAVHSESGHTERLGGAVRDGAATVDGVEAVLRRVSDVTDDEIRRADGVVVGTPVQWGGLSADTKRFLDRVAAVLGPDLGEGRTAAAFCTGGAVSSGKELARLSILAAFLNMRFVILGGVEADGFGSLGAQATTGPDSPGLDDPELADGRRFGERLARLTLRIRRALLDSPAP